MPRSQVHGVEGVAHLFAQAGWWLEAVDYRWSSCTMSIEKQHTEIEINSSKRSSVLFNLLLLQSYAIKELDIAVTCWLVIWRMNPCPCVAAATVIL